jgi:hypothetical protein
MHWFKTAIYSSPPPRRAFADWQKTDHVAPRSAESSLGIALTSHSVVAPCFDYPRKATDCTGSAGVVVKGRHQVRDFGCRG